MSKMKLMAIGLLGCSLLLGCSADSEPTTNTSTSGTHGASGETTPATVQLTAESRSLEEVQAEIADSGKIVILDLWATW
jgi:hypothetical protein